MDLSVESLCGLLVRSKLLDTEDVKTLYQRWQNEAPAARNDASQFSRWLVAGGHVTPYQAAMLTRGKADHFFVDKYKILARIGKGRMAGVFQAVHELGQLVAIKILPPSMAKEPQRLARFHREAHLALRLRHPNVVQAFHTGQAGKVHYLAMEYLEGETLDAVLRRRGKLPPLEAARLIHQTLLGLQHLHERGVVHRDLKPSNMMLVPACGRNGGADDTLRSQVKILDIGLGRTLREEASPQAAVELTGEGALLGTPDYLAPEQARDAHHSDIRADIYSVGCIFYHLLTGQTPFPDTNIISQLVRHTTEKPKPLADLNPDVPEGLQQIVDWMLAKDPAQRYQTPERAAQALKVFLSTTPEQNGVTDVADPKMKQYLQWLETNQAATKEASLAAPSVAEELPETVPVPVPEFALPPLKVKEPAAIEPMPAAPEADYVELVFAQPAARFRLTLRDWMMMGIGAGAVIVVALLGMLAARLR